MANHYVAEFTANTTPVTGQFLARNRHSLVEKAFLAADLHTGKCRLTAPTVLQAARLARVNSTYVHHALAREANRHDIERGVLPLMPRNGHPPALVKLPVVNDALVADVIRAVGIDHVLTIAAAVEQNAA